MTELIVALDGPRPLQLMERLWCDAKVDWFKVGPLATLDGSWSKLASTARGLNISLFYDAKLADYGPYVCEEFAKRLAGAGYSALSTSTDEATEAVVRGAKGSPLKVWRHVQSTFQKNTRGDQDRAKEISIRAMDQGAHGAICPINLAYWVQRPWKRHCDIVVPGFRLDGDDSGGHVNVSLASEYVDHGNYSDCVTHYVVGRPIWRSSDPVAAAKRYVEALK